MSAIARAALVWLAAWLVVACETRRSIAEDAFVQAAVDAECGDTLACCKKSGFEHVRADCKTGFTKSWSSDAKAARAAGARYDGVMAAECVDEIRQSIRECESVKLDDPELRAQPCADVYRGGKARLGAKCMSGWECGGTSEDPRECVARFEREASAIVRRCNAVVTLGRGEAAAADAGANAAHRCVPGLLPDGDGVCRARYALGERCNVPAASDFCQPGLVCDALNTNRCVTALPIGAKCTELNQCEGFACQMGRCAVPSGAYCE